LPLRLRAAYCWLLALLRAARNGFSFFGNNRRTDLRFVGVGLPSRLAHVSLVRSDYFPFGVDRTRHSCRLFGETTAFTAAHSHAFFGATRTPLPWHGTLRSEPTRLPWGYGFASWPETRIQSG